MFDVTILILGAAIAAAFLMLPRTVGSLRSRGFAIALVLTIGYGAFDCIKFVDQQDEGILLTFGQASEEAVSPGLKFILPWQEIETLSVLQQEYRPMITNPDGTQTGQEQVYECASRDLQEVKTKMTVLWRRKRGKAPQIWRLFGNDSEPMVAAGVNEALKAAFAEYDATKAAQNRNAMKALIDEKISNWLEKFDHELVEVSLGDYVFTNEFQSAINAKREAYEDALAAENEVQKHEIYAKTAEATARGKAEGTIEQAHGQAAKVRLEAEAEAYRIIRNAKADALAIVETGRAEAIGIANLRDALKENPGFTTLEAIRAWKGGTSEFLLNQEGGKTPNLLMEMPQKSSQPGTTEQK